MYTVENRVGRLVETRVVSLTDDEVRMFTEEHRRMGERLRRFVIVADYRAVKIFPPSVAEALQRLMSGMNPAVERSALLVEAGHATNFMQVERIVRQAAHPERRAFRDPRELTAWLGEKLDADERRRLEQFLAQPAASG